MKAFSLCTVFLGLASTAACTLVARADSKLSNPFLFNNGTAVTTKAQWADRRKELLTLFQNDELGVLPGPPTSVTASFSGGTLSITVTDQGKSISFSVSISTPSGGTAPYPAIIAYGGGSLPKPNGVAIINFNNDDIAAQQDSSSRGKGKFYNIYGSGHSAGAMTAWAWGVSRVIDALEKTPSANIDTKRLGVTGCSRNGKGAFVAGAFEERILLTIPQESGSGGSGCWRLSDDMMSRGQNTQTAKEIVGENVWFSQNFNTYVSNIPTLPFDHHELVGLVAPRPLFVIENTDYLWLGPWSSYGCMTTGHRIYEALGIPDLFGFSQRGGHSHCAFPSNQQGDLDAFVNTFLLQKTGTSTAIMKSDVTDKFDASTWASWSTPKLT